MHSLISHASDGASNLVTFGRPHPIPKYDSVRAVAPHKIGQIAKKLASFRRQMKIGTSCAIGIRP